MRCTEHAHAYMHSCTEHAHTCTPVLSACSHIYMYMHSCTEHAHAYMHSCTEHVHTCTPVLSMFTHALLYMYTAVCRELANQKSEKRYCACSVFERSKEKRERITFRFFGSCKNSANRCTEHVHTCTPVLSMLTHALLY